MSLEYLDAGIFIAAIDKNHIANKECEELLLKLISEKRAVTSLATLEEVLHRIRRVPYAQEFIRELLNNEGLYKIPLTLDIMTNSIDIIFDLGIDAFDAIAISTALNTGATVFWTVDIRLIEKIMHIIKEKPGSKIARLTFKTPVDIQLLKRKSKESALKKVTRNLENAVINHAYAMNKKITISQLRNTVDALKNTLKEKLSDI